MTAKERKKLDRYYSKYGVNYAWYEMRWKLQGECCALCKRKPKEGQRRFHLDHNHTSGAPRSIVCFYCNKFLIGRHTLITAWDLLAYMMKYDA